MIKRTSLVFALALLLLFAAAGCSALPGEEGAQPAAKSAGSLGIKAPAPVAGKGLLGKPLPAAQDASQAVSSGQGNAAAETRPPETVMDTLPQSSDNSAVRLAWRVLSGADEVEHFELQVRAGSGEWTEWGGPIDSRERERLFFGKPGEVYDFRLRAINLIGQVEEFPAAAEAAIYILPDCADDAYEGAGKGDDEQTSAPLAAYWQTQAHTWCGLGDVDWVRFEADAGSGFTLRAVPRGEGSAALIQLYDGKGSLLGEAKPADVNATTALDWTAADDGVYAARLSPADERAAGDGAAYEFTVDKESTIQPVILFTAAGVVLALLGGMVLAGKKVKQAKRRKGLGW